MALRPFLPTNAFTFLLLLSAASSLAAKSSPIPISDEEINDKKQTCYADIDRSSMIEMENCALRCVSPVCYELIYESDPLEEGEKDYVRSQEYRYCMRRTSVGLDIDQVKGTFSDSQFEVKSSSMSLPGSVRMVGVRRK